MTYLPGDRVTFGATLGDLAGTVEALHGDDVYTVRPDDGEFPRMLLLGRALRAVPGSG